MLKKEVCDVVCVTLMYMTIFSKIIKGDIPSYKVYENEYVYAMLDINPMQEGHTLVIPKKEVAYLFDMEKGDYERLMEGVQHVACMLKERLQCKRVCVLVEGYQVEHVHVNLIPTWGEHDLDRKFVHVGSKEELESAHLKLLSSHR